MVYFLCKAYDSDRQNCYFALSLPVRGAWIEIVMIAGPDGINRRSPCGERGLKFARFINRHAVRLSLPVRGAWIEIDVSAVWRLGKVSLPVRGAWIEMSPLLRSM